MGTISLIAPLDQPTGRSRLLRHLIDGLQERQFSQFKFIVAFAKAGPLLRMQSVIEASLSRGMRIEAIFGVDQQGTSAQALRFALDRFNNVYIIREPNLTFHPKMYEFEGSAAARLYVGSNNLTVGGTETNFETAMRLDFVLPEDAANLQLFTDCWNEMMPTVCPATKRLTEALLSELILDGTVPDETVMRRTAVASATGRSIPRAPRSGLRVKPASPLPARRAIRTPAPTITASHTRSATAAAVQTVSDPYAAHGFAIQIKPHHNGEIFLSVTAVFQNPQFFGWPFTGLTVPKRGTNTAYPQLTPDPHVKVIVYGSSLTPILELSDYALNTVYYERKSEIRITASPLVGIVPDYSVMIIRESEASTLDYEITIHTPASPDYSAWVAACNQSMPSGGRTPRKFGWF